MKKYKLGQKITITSVLKRTDVTVAEDRFGTKTKKWVSVDLPEPEEVIIVGVRTISDGTFTPGASAGNGVWKRTDAFRALLVAPHLTTTYLVLPE